MSRPTVAIVPLRSPGAGKTRLSPALDAGQRARLVGAMLGDVVSALRLARVDRVVVAAGGDAAASAAAALGVEVVADRDGARGLDAVLAATVEVVTRPTDDVLVVPADLPRLTPDDVLALLTAPAEVVVAPTNGGGTGGLLRRGPARIPTAYGPGSAARHREAAMAAGVSVRTVDRAGFRHDVDTWDDLVALRDVEVGAATAAVLPALLDRLAG